MARDDGSGVIHVFLDRLPIGGFGGHVVLAPIGEEPPPAEPQRPGESDACGSEQA